MVSDFAQVSELSKQHKDISKRIKPNQVFEFTILDSTKWPIKQSQDEVITLPRQLRDVFEEFT